MDLMTRRRAIMGMPSGYDYTISNANVIRISDALAKNAKSLIVSFSPKQSGSGDPSPSNVRPISGYNDIGAVRYGKNMWSMTACVGCSYNPARGTVFDTTPATLQPTDNGDGSFSVTIGSWERVCFIVPVPNGASVRSSFSRSGAGGRRTIGWLDADKKVIGSNNNNTDANENYSSTWTASGGAKNLFFIFTSNTASTQTITYPQVEIGNTATQYEPYISPVTANVHVGGAGKNKLNPATTSLTNSTVFGLSATWSDDGVLHFSGTWTGATANSVRVLGVDPAVRSLAVKGFSTGHVSLRWQNGEDRIVADFTSMTNGSTYDITVWPMVYEGTAPSFYEPYSLFGGTVDFVSGECVVDMGYIDLGTKNYLYRNSRFDATFSDGKLTLLNSGGAKAIASAYARSTNAYSSIPDLAFNFGSGYVNGSTCSIVVHDSRYTDATSFKSAVSGVMLCYELATPITYQLTPSQLALLKGNNTVYSNEGSISLTYVGK